MPPLTPWTTLSSRRLLERWWMTLREDRVRLPSGHVLDEYHVAEYPDWACVLALTDDGRAVLVEQYRHGIGRVILELPAGVIDEGEAPLAAARRELVEETGFGARQWEGMGRLAVEPGRHTNYGHVFIARGAELVQAPALDVSEDLRVRLVPAPELPSLVASGAMPHGVHAAAVYWAASRGWLGPAEPGPGACVDRGPSTPHPMQKEQKTLLVSVETEIEDNQDALITHIGQKVGQGWKVIQAIPLSGEEAGPGGISEDYMRYQVTVEREVDSDNVVVDADRGGAADMKDVGQVSAAFDGPINDDPDDAS